MESGGSGWVSEAGRSRLEWSGSEWVLEGWSGVWQGRGEQIGEG